MRTRRVNRTVILFNQFNTLTVPMPSYIINKKMHVLRARTLLYKYGNYT